MVKKFYLPNHSVTCSECNSLLQYDIEDVNRFDDGSSLIFSIKCPCCGSTVLVSPREYEAEIEKRKEEILNRPANEPKTILSDQIRNKNAALSLISVFTENGKRRIQYLGYGYTNHGSCEKDTAYSFIEYCFFEVDLDEVLKTGVLEFEKRNAEFYKQYYAECSWEDLTALYLTYVKESPSKIIKNAEVTKNIPDGVYIVLDD